MSLKVYYNIPSNVYISLFITNIYKMLKLFKYLFILVVSLVGFSFADNYTYFYAQWCTHCENVDKFFKANSIEEKFSIKKYEIYFDQNWRKEFMNIMTKLNVAENEKEVPFLVINQDNGISFYKVWEYNILNYFTNKMWAVALAASTWSVSTWMVSQTSTPLNNSGSALSWWVSWLTPPAHPTDLNSRMKFFLVLIPAALADSINPCEFAILLLLLSSILTRHKNYRKMYLAWALFILAIFVSYLAMWLGLYKALASASNTYYLKLIVWIVWLIVWLVNIKDYFWYGDGGLFAMEVPLAWRPKMHKIVQSIISPWWAFVIWVVISLFLLPCTSGPYVTILWYLAAESNTITNWWYIYLIVYNIIFILPMLAIVIIVWSWYKTIDELAKLRKRNLRLIHLVIWLLMLWLGFYVLYDVLIW